MRTSTMKWLIMLVLLTVIGCNSIDNKTGSDKITSNKRSTYFEGEVHYSVEYSQMESYLNEKYLKDAVGAKSILYFKDGNHRKDYFNTNGDLISQRFLDLESKKSYSIKPGEDTVYWFDITKPDSKTSFSEGADTVINEYDCLKLLTTTITPNPKFPGENFEITGVSYYAKDLKINPEWYASYFEGSYHRIAELSKAIMVLYVERLPYWTAHTKVDSVIWREIDNKEISTQFLKHKEAIEL